MNTRPFGYFFSCLLPARIGRILMVGGLIASVVHCSHAGPWPKKQGSGFVQIGFSTISYNKVYNDRGKKQALHGDVRDNVLQMFCDIGITGQLSGSAMVPIKFLSASSGGMQIDKSGLGDIDFGLRYNWLNEGGHAFSTGLDFGVPTGTQDDPDGLFLGDGEFNVAARLLYGRSLHPAPAYLAIDVAFNFRSNDFSHDVLYNLEGGYGLLDSRLYFIVLISGRESVSSKPTVSPASSAAEIRASMLGLLSSNQEYLAIIPKVLYRFSRHWGATGSWATALHGRNVAGGFVFAGSVFHEF